MLVCRNAECIRRHMGNRKIADKMTANKITKKFIHVMSVKILNLILWVYLVLIVFVMPFYMQNGYVNIGEAKFVFFKYVTLGMIALVLPFLVVLLCTGNLQEKWYHISIEQIHMLDVCMILYGMALTISYLAAEDQETALWGEQGWYMGYLTKFSLIVVYFLISRLWSYKKAVWYLGMVASGVVFLLGILNRFSIYPIDFDLRSPDFISTLGNINWFSGYLSVFCPIGMCLYLFAKNTLARVFACAYVMLAFAAGVTQGSSSIFLAFFGCFYFLLLLVYREKKDGMRLLELGILFALVCEIIRVWRFLCPNAYNYDTGNLCGIATSSNLPAIAGMLLILIYYVGLYRGKKSMEGHAGTGCYLIVRDQVMKVLLILPWVLAGIYFILALVINGLHIQIPWLSEWKWFQFDGSFGNSRGTTWLAGLMAFKELPLLHKIVGCGPDCFESFVYTRWELIVMLEKEFGNASLTNAHNELLTTLVNLGVLGCVTYLGVLLWPVIRCFRSKKGNLLLYFPVICIVSYSMHNMVSFAQILNYPYLFIFLGISEGLIRRSKGKCTAAPNS